MNCSANSSRVFIYRVNPDSWIVRALENNGYNLDNCLGFYNYARTEYRDPEGYPEYIQGRGELALRLLSYSFLSGPANSGLFYL